MARGYGTQFHSNGVMHIAGVDGTIIGVTMLPASSRSVTLVKAVWVSLKIPSMLDYRAVPREWDWDVRRGDRQRLTIEHYRIRPRGRGNRASGATFFYRQPGYRHKDPPADSDPASPARFGFVTTTKSTSLRPPHRIIHWRLLRKARSSCDRLAESDDSPLVGS